MRELHWHPNADEWQYYLRGQARMTVFDPGPKATPPTSAPGDVGVVRKNLGHYVENTGSDVMQFLEVFRRHRYEEISLAEWLRCLYRHDNRDAFAATRHAAGRARNSGRVAATEHIRSRDFADAPLAFAAIWLAVAGRPSFGATLALLAVWALAMGMQSAAVRWLDVGGVFTTAATATFIFLAGSFARRPLSAEERRRLSGVLASLIIGGTAGAYLLIHAPAYTTVLPLVITIAVVAMAARAFGYRDEAI